MPGFLPPRFALGGDLRNTLKTKGYQFEHSFGHGQRFLSQTLLSLNSLLFCSTPCWSS